MGQKDIVEKHLEDYNDVFADIVNALVFKGKQAVRPRDLIPVKVRSQYKADEGKLHEEERDNACRLNFHSPEVCRYLSVGRIRRFSTDTTAGSRSRGE